MTWHAWAAAYDGLQPFGPSILHSLRSLLLPPHETPPPHPLTALGQRLHVQGRLYILVRWRLRRWWDWRRVCCVRFRHRLHRLRRALLSTAAVAAAATCGAFTAAVAVATAITAFSTRAAAPAAVSASSAAPAAAQPSLLGRDGFNPHPGPQRLDARRDARSQARRHRAR